MENKDQIIAVSPRLDPSQTNLPPGEPEACQECGHQVWISTSTIEAIEKDRPGGSIGMIVECMDCVAKKIREGADVTIMPPSIGQLRDFLKHRGGKQ